MSRSRLLLATLVVSAASLSMPAVAEWTVGTDTVTLDVPGAAQGARTVNAASGVNNQQANVGVIARGREGVAFGSLRQDLDIASGGEERAAEASIAAGAFAGSNGWTAVNAVAGADNQQANLAIIATAIDGRIMSDAMLGQTRASQSPPEGQSDSAAAPDRSATLGDGAFAGGSGLVQVNLVGGDRNSTANTFALSVLGAANPR